MLDPKNNWPESPEFTKETGERHPDNVFVKKDILAKYGEKALRQSWAKVCQSLELITKTIAVKQSAVIQEIEYSDLAILSDERKSELKKTGCFVIRNVIPRETGDEWFAQLQEYVTDNKNSITCECQLFWIKGDEETALTSNYRMATGATIYPQAFLVPNASSSTHLSQRPCSPPRTQLLVA
jgi:hypothetical protein